MNNQLQALHRLRLLGVDDMQRQEMLQDFIEPVIQLNEALRSAASRVDHKTAARCLAQGADIAYALKGYAKAGDMAALNRLLAVAKYILYCQYRRDTRGLAGDIENALTNISFILPLDIDRLLKDAGILYPVNYYQGVAGLAGYDETNDPALNTADLLSMLQYLFSSAVGGMLASKADTMIHELFEKRCFENPLLAMRFFSHIDDAEQRLEFYAAAAAICLQQRLVYFFNHADKNEFLARAALINQLIRSYQLSYELAHTVACEPAMIGWFQAMVENGNFARMVPRDIGRLVAGFVAGQAVTNQLDHQLDAYALAASTTAPVATAVNYFSSLVGRFFGFYSTLTAADAARPDVDSIRPWGGY